MRSRRHTSKIILAVASVFLLLIVSCGIPTYIVPKVDFSNKNPGDNSDSFTVTYNCSDPLGDSGRVGLLLLYHLEATMPPSNGRKDISSKFTSQFIPSEYNGAEVDVKEGTPVLTAGGFDVYAFERNGSVINDPDYTILLPNSDDFSRDVKLDYLDGEILLSVGGIHVATLSLDPATAVDNYIAIYAAVSVRSNNYTNHYWSELKFVGYIKVTD